MKRRKLLHWSGLTALLGIFGFRQNVQAKAAGEHDWYVISTALAEVCLLLECRKTGKTGVVSNPTREEWNRAYHAPSNPYKWEDDSRVEIQDNA